MSHIRGAVFCLLHAALVATVAVSYPSAVNPETRRPYNEIVVGGLCNAGADFLYQRWNTTFAE